MTVSTNAEISYGIGFDDGFSFPWDDDLYGGDIDEWWRKKGSGYTPSFEIYDEAGEFIDGKRPSDEVYNAYWDAYWAFDKEHPIPVELVNVCSADYPLYILALAETVITVNRGYPRVLNPASLVVTDEQRNTLIKFCKTHNIDIGDAEPNWYLSSYWG